ncbi:hypothetical protein QQF64_036310 [Cirrhinus molitorella]|uniref:Uncharacterized protein n=1 Tax=Cirrhinus molitorella TaxID=172907 RepID=A0ABR3NIV7_9TELE
MDSTEPYFDPEAYLCTIFQDGRELEVYVKEFLEYSHLTTWSEHFLIHCFKVGLDDEVCQVLSGINVCENLEQFLDLALKRCGSSFTVGPVDDGNVIIPTSLASACPNFPCHQSLQATSLTLSQPLHSEFGVKSSRSTYCIG